MRPNTEDCECRRNGIPRNSAIGTYTPDDHLDELEARAIAPGRQPVYLFRTALSL